jgi:hypothetical protein
VSLPYRTVPDPASTLNFEAIGAQLPVYAERLPDTPRDGQEVYYAADAANGVIWHLRYRSAASGSHKWEFVGGSEIESYYHSGQNTTSTTFVNPSNQLSITAPLSGSYDITIASQLGNGTGNQAYHSYKIGSGSADSGAGVISGGITRVGSLQKTRRLSCSAGDQIVDQIASGGGSALFQTRRLSVIPVRVG